MNLLADLQDEFDLTYVFVSHDLSVVRYIADDVLVLSKGVAVEQGSREAAVRQPAAPLHPAAFRSDAGDRRRRDPRTSGTPQGGKDWCVIELRR